MSSRRKSSRRRGSRPTNVLGYDVDESMAPVRTRIDVARQGDYGADPVGDGTFRMVPSGDIVSYEERIRRLPLRRNFSPAHRGEKDFRWHLDHALGDLKMLHGDPVRGLRTAQIAIVYANILDDGPALATGHRYVKRFESELYKAI